MKIAVFNFLSLFFFFNLKSVYACDCGFVLGPPPPPFYVCSEGNSYTQTSCTKHISCYGFDEEYSFDACSTDYNIKTQTAEMDNNPSKQCGSIVKIENQSLQENIPLTGSGLDLVYSSERVFGRKDVRKFSETIYQPTDPNVTRIYLTHTYHGTGHVTNYPVNVDNTYAFEWDGLDAFSNEVIDGIKTSIQIEYEYNGTTRSVIYKKDHNVGFYNPVLLGLGGLTLSNHHFFNTKLGKLHMGYGLDRVVEPMYIDLVGDRVDILNASSTAFTHYLVASEDGREAYIFDVDGYHLETRSTLSSKVLTSFGYDINKKLISVEDAFSNTITFTRPNSTTVEITLPSGKATTLTLNAKGYAVEVSTPNAETYLLSYYDPSTNKGLMATFQNPKGLISSFTYDADGNLLEDSNNAGQSVEINVVNIQPSYKLIEAISAEGRITQYYTNMTEPGQSVKTITTSSGASYTQSDVKLTPSIARPDSSSEAGSAVYNPRFNTQAYYDLARTISSHGATHYVNTYNNQIYPYDDLLNLTSHTETINFYSNQWITEYDGSSKTFTKTSPLGREIKTEVNDYDQVVETQLASFLPVTYTYDSKGRVTEMAQGTNITQYTYNLEDEVATVSQQRFRTIALPQIYFITTEFEYDVNGRVVEASRVGGDTTYFEYDEMGNMKRIKAGSGFWHEFLYSLFGSILKYIMPSLNLTIPEVSYEYNNDKQLTKVIRENNDEINYVYNSTSGFLEQIQTTEGNYIYDRDVYTEQIQFLQSPNLIKVNYDYNSDAIEKISIDDQDDKSTVTYAYNKMLRSVIEVNHIDLNSNESHTANLVYNNDRLLTSAGDLSITRTNSTGLVATTMLGNITETYTYNADYGQLVQFNVKYLGNHLFNETYQSVNNDSLLTNTSETNPSNVTIWKTSLNDVNERLNFYAISMNERYYLYDDRGNRTNVRTRVRIPGVGQTYPDLGIATYNSHDQQITYQILDATSNILNDYTYTYNDFGQRLTKVDSVTNIQEDYVYNSIGALTQYTKTDTSTSAVMYTITYNNDALGRRITKTKDAVLLKRYIYDENIRLIGEVSPDGETLTHYVYGHKFNVPAYMNRDGVNYKIISNHQGSVRYVVNASTGSVAQEITYDGWGQVLTDTNPGFQPFGFAGGIYDHDTKLTRFGARDYDAETGRWTAKDPILFKGGDTNLYGYVLNNPVNFIDPTGENPLILLGLAGFAGPFIGTYINEGLTFKATTNAFVAGTCGAVSTVAFGGVGSLANVFKGPASAIAGKAVSTPLSAVGGVFGNLGGSLLGGLTASGDVLGSGPMTPFRQ